MTDQLREMLREAADGHPQFDLAADPWHKGRRRRRRRRVAGAGATAVATLITVGVIATDAPSLSSGPAPPAGDVAGEPTLPDRLFDVAPDVPDVTDDPLGGPAALVYDGPHVRVGVFEANGSVPLVVGATNDRIRAVRALDGPADHVALSPDGSHLATAPYDIEPQRAEPPTVVVTDLRDGTERAFSYPDQGLGGTVYRVLWAPDGRELAVSAITTTERSEDSSSGNDHQLMLDVGSGEWRDRDYDVPEAFSPDGTLELRTTVDGAVVAEADGVVIADLVVPRPDERVDGRRVAAGAPGLVGAHFSPAADRVAMVADWNANNFGIAKLHTVEIFDVTTGRHEESVSLGELEWVRSFGWGSRGLLVATTGEDGDANLRRFDLSNRGAADDVIDIGNVNAWQLRDIAETLVDADVRVAEPPPRWIDRASMLQLAVLAAVILAGWAWAWRRRRPGRTAQRDHVGLC